MNDSLEPRRLRPSPPWGLMPVLLVLGCGDDAVIRSGPGGAGQAGSETWEPPPLRDPLSLGDEALGRAALELMGSSAVGAEGSCRNCHSLGRPTLTRWAALTESFSADCLENAELSDQAAVDETLACFRARTQPGQEPLPSQFGIYAAAAHLPWFSFVFERASGPLGDRQAEHEDFVTDVGMPRAGTLLSQVEFDVIAEWFARGLPRLYELVPEESGEDCIAEVSPRLSAHVRARGLDGWRARNERTPLLMFGCDDDQTGAECLGELPLARDEAFGEGWDAPGDAQIRVLADNSDTLTRFWSRSSADGRFIASGLIDRGASDYTGQFLDLQLGQTIAVDFSYDPTFFPDNSGFLIQRGGGFSSAPSGGGPTNGSADLGDVAVVCDQSVLSSEPASISGDEAACIQLDSQIGLYQQLAKSLDGEDYWVVYGSYDSDNGGFSPVLENPSATFASDSQVTMVPMINQGARFEAGTAVRVATPLQGDPMLSPSGRLLVTRVKGQESTRDLDGDRIVTAEQSGYALHLVTTPSDGAGPVSLEDVGRVCMQGGKAVVSYDERWMIFHHYVTPGDARELGFSGPDDLEFEDYAALGASNLYLVDLLDGSVFPITNMSPGQYALFPHFRSDGWIYFVVRTLDGDEFFAASDAALLLEADGE